MMADLLFPTNTPQANRQLASATSPAGLASVFQLTQQPAVSRPIPAGMVLKVAASGRR